MAEALGAIDGSGIAGLIIEPMIQGAAGMRLWPSGILKTLRQWCDDNGVLLIFDEVMTGFGRTGKYFACQHEEVYPDFLAIAKGLTGGYLPLAATLTTDRVFSGFLGSSRRLSFMATAIVVIRSVAPSPSRTLPCLKRGVCWKNCNQRLNTSPGGCRAWKTCRMSGRFGEPDLLGGLRSLSETEIRSMGVIR